MAAPAKEETKAVMVVQKGWGKERNVGLFRWSRSRGEDEAL